MLQHAAHFVDTEDAGTRTGTLARGACSRLTRSCRSTSLFPAVKAQNACFCVAAAAAFSMASGARNAVTSAASTSDGVVCRERR